MDAEADDAAGQYFILLFTKYRRIVPKDGTKQEKMRTENAEMLTDLNHEIGTKCSNDYENEEKLLIAVLKKAFGEAMDFSIEDADLDRVYFSMDGNEYIVRMWNINENKIDWTLYKCVEDHGEAITDGCCCF